MKAEAIRELPVKPPIKEVVINLSAREAAILRCIIGAFPTNKLHSELTGAGYTRPEYLDKLEVKEVKNFVEELHGHLLDLKLVKADESYRRV